MVSLMYEQVKEGVCNINYGFLVVRTYVIITKACTQHFIESKEVINSIITLKILYLCIIFMKHSVSSLNFVT